MGYLPQNSTFTVRPMHRRGITRCLALGMTDKEAMSKACGFPDVDTFYDSLTAGQKIIIGKSKKAAAKRLLEDE